MPDDQPFRLELTPAGLARFCRQAAGRARDTGDALRGLTTLQAFIGTHAIDPNQPAYRSARAALDAEIDALRARLLEEHRSALARALADRDAAAVTDSFTALSRSGFREAAAQALTALDAATRAAAAHWLADWCDEARRRAAAASRYPDALDFRSAGVAAETFLALDELRDIEARTQARQRT